MRGLPIIIPDKDPNLSMPSSIDENQICKYDSSEFGRSQPPPFSHPFFSPIPSFTFIHTQQEATSIASHVWSIDAPPLLHINRT
jgi:hypothetical protein